MPDPLIGRALGRYQIHQEIGRGGMARVYRATDTLLQRPVALKMLAPHLSDDPEFAKRFEREAITAANLRHPAIITIFDVGEVDGLRYIAMEYIAGCTLHEVIANRGKLGLPLERRRCSRRSPMRCIMLTRAARSIATSSRITS